MTTPVFDATTSLMQVLRDRQGHALLAQTVPSLVSSPILHTLYQHPIGLVLATEPSMIDDTPTQLELLRRLAQIEPATRDAQSPTLQRVPEVIPEPAETVPASAALTGPAAVPAYDRIEWVIAGPTSGNPFVDVVLEAEVTGPGGADVVAGFYDGEGVYRLRYLPLHEGEHLVTVRSNVRSIDGLATTFTADAPRAGSHGPVRVARTFHFAYDDGTPYRPVGTTAYVWTHQPEALQEQTLRTLAASPFNKIRMCVFPKSYLFNENEPDRYPFEGDPGRGFDFTRPSPAYWAHLEQRIDALRDLGVEADVILFHAYDRWGFSTMSADADDRYVAYAVSRLASFSNVWWSVANEYDLLFEKTEADWERLAAVIGDGDPFGHLTSIHNCRPFYDHTRPWITHASVQRQDVYRTAEYTDEWRRAWGKPVVVDECAYEGDIDQGWGNISGEEMVRRCWEGAVRGGYVGHGETYVDPDDTLWWAKGGALRGSSPDRIAFLRRVLEEGPHGLEPIQLDWDVPSAGVMNQYLLVYYGFERPTYRRFLLDPAVSYEIDVIDTWGMTIERLPRIHRGRFRIELPGRQYMAVRLNAL